MPLTLDSTAALRGEKPRRRWTLVVTSHQRWHYTARTLNALDGNMGLGWFDRRVLSVDGDSTHTPDSRMEVVRTGSRQGLTANLKQAWGALTPEDEWVLHLEEDMVLREAPLEAMADVLDQNRDLAQMALVRQPWSMEEHQAGGLLFGPHIRGQVTDRGGWLEHDRIFTLNPFVAHASLLRSLQPSVESSLTQQCRERGLSFGFWGGLHDPPRVEHIGYEGGMGSPLWKP